jgi:hypothetical protein
LYLFLGYCWEVSLSLGDCAPQFISKRKQVRLGMTLRTNRGSSGSKTTITVEGAIRGFSLTGRVSHESGRAGLMQVNNYVTKPNPILTSSKPHPEPVIASPRRCGSRSSCAAPSWVAAGINASCIYPPRGAAWTNTSRCSKPSSNGPTQLRRS